MPHPSVDDQHEVDPQKLVTTAGAMPGETLVLTKPLGSGILATALKGEVIKEEQTVEAIRGMEILNRSASEAMLKVGVNACTDITGFGLLGHALELAVASRIGLEIDAAGLHIYPQVMDWPRSAWYRSAAIATVNTTCLEWLTVSRLHLKLLISLHIFKLRVDY
jgi:selenophosphate synthase